MKLLNKITKSRNFICLLLVVSVLTSGIWQEHTQVRALSAHGNPSSCASISQPESVSFSTEITSKELNYRIINSIKSYQNQDNRSPQKLHSYLSAVNTLPHFHYDATVVYLCQFFSEIYSNSIIINYIHRQDGKKPRL